MRRGLLAAALLGAAPVFAQDLPPLPAGLGGGPPALPAGLGDAPDVAQPDIVLPDMPAPAPPPAPQGPVAVTGFTELRYAARLDDDPLQDGPTLSELRLHLELDGTTIPFRLAADLLAEPLEEDTSGENIFDLREANILLRPADAVDMRLGRQILTWGTGDLLFINDVFPKDFVSFFAGRSDDYLKAPADAARIGLFTELVNLDLVVMSAQSVDRTIDGERLSFTDPASGAPRGRDAVFRSDAPEGAEYALRAYRTFGAVEVAGYAYAGHWKSPAGNDPATGNGTYPALSVYGASIRGPLAGGIASAEAGHYDSRDDADGSDPFVANSETRILLGFEREIAQETTLGLQYYAARMADYDSYLAAAPAGSVLRDETRDLVTLRLTRLALNQTLTASAFAFYSPTQEDSFLRLGLSYRPTDALTLDAGLGRFGGDADTPFGQFEAASHVSLGLRYSF